jgi:hypothetical protein
MPLYAQIYTNRPGRRPGVKGVCVLNANGPDYFAPSAEYPAVILDTGWAGPLTAGLVRAVPVQTEGNLKGQPRPCMAASGDYISSSDSRFGDAVERLTGARFYGAVALHDHDLAAEAHGTGD